MIEVTLGIIKPSGQYAKDQIKKVIKISGLEILKEKNMEIGKEEASLQYKGLGEFFNNAVEAITKYEHKGREIKESTILLLRGENAVEKLILIAGNDITKGGVPDYSTIRGRFGKGEKNNAFHRADSEKSVKREIGIYFKEKELPDYIIDILNSQ